MTNAPYELLPDRDCSRSPRVRHFPVSIGRVNRSYGGLGRRFRMDENAFVRECVRTRPAEPHI
jgi:hypothetical protein